MKCGLSWVETPATVVVSFMNSDGRWTIASTSSLKGLLSVLRVEGSFENKYSCLLLLPVMQKYVNDKF
jgi:hypothetical protein